MYLETIIALLVIGNIYLFLRPKRKGAEYSSGTGGMITSAFDEGLADSKERGEVLKNPGPRGTLTVQEEEFAEKSELAVVRERIALLSAKQEGMERRLEFVSRRVKGIDSLLEEGARKKISELGVIEKINRLDEFRRQAVIEIEALKQKLPREGKKEQEKLDEHTERKIHNLVFHANKEN